MDWALYYKQVFGHGAMQIENPYNGNVFKVNGQRLKLFYEGFVALGSDKESTRVIRRSISRTQPTGIVSL